MRGAAPDFKLGQTVNVRHTYGLTNPEWRVGIITDLFLAPITGGWVFVVGGCGYYEHEIRTLDQETELHSVRA